MANTPTHSTCALCNLNYHLKYKPWLILNVKINIISNVCRKPFYTISSWYSLILSYYVFLVESSLFTTEKILAQISGTFLLNILHSWNWKKIAFFCKIWISSDTSIIIFQTFTKINEIFFVVVELVILYILSFTKGNFYTLQYFK